jgi:hypothetical protein
MVQADNIRMSNQSKLPKSVSAEIRALLDAGFDRIVVERHESERASEKSTFWTVEADDAMAND